MHPRLQHISDAERRFLLDGVAQGFRNDGRGCFDCRRITYETGTIPAATSSCRLRAGETDLIVGVKCDVAKPSSQRPNAGMFHISVDCATSVSISLTEGWNAEEWGRQLSVLLESLCASDGVIDREALCIVPGTFAWEVHADVLVLATGGNLLDSVSLALCAALSETVLPKIEVQDELEEGEHVQLRVDDRPELGVCFPLRKMPLCVTVAQIQDRFILDVTLEEEICADALLCVVVDARSGDIAGIHKLGRGLFDLAALPAAVEHCRATASLMMQQLEREMKSKAAP